MGEGVTLVTGASGVLGRAVVETLTRAGRPVRGLARRGPPPGVASDWGRCDLLTGEGLAEALRGAGAVVHCASDPRRPADDLAALDRLLAATPPAVHIVYVGIAGIERAARGYGYYAAKLEAERRLAASGRPHTIVRATQFHDLVDYMLGRLDLKVAIAVPRGVRLRPVDVRFVAERLAAHAVSEPCGRAPDLHGPEPLAFSGLARGWLQTRGRRTPVLAVPLPFGVFKALAELEPVSGEIGGASWGSWLQRTAAQPSAYVAR